MFEKGVAPYGVVSQGQNPGLFTVARSLFFRQLRDLFQSFAIFKTRRVVFDTEVNLMQMVGKTMLSRVWSVQSRGHKSLVFD